MEASLIYRSPAPVWRWLFADDGAHAVLEHRDEAQRQASFTALRWPSGEALWEEGQLEEPWWASMACVAHGALVVQLLAEAPHPEPRALVSLDLALGEGRWQADGHALLWACEGGLWCRSAQGDRLLDASTGRALPDPAGAPLAPPWRLPHRYLAADAHFGTVAAFLRKRLGVEPAGAIDYWEQGGTMAVGYHAVEGIRYSYWLLLLDGQGEVLAHDRLHEGGKGIGTEGFGLLGGALFYLRQGVELWRRPLPIE